MPLQDFVQPPPQTDPGEAYRGKLGRILAPDSRDYDVRALFEAAPEPPEELDQWVWFPPRLPITQEGDSCTAFALAHRYLAAPQEHRRGRLPFDPLAHYHFSQSIDEWRGGEQAPARQPGDPFYSGTSVRASLEAARLGYTTPSGVVVPPFIHSYWALKTFEDLRRYLLSAAYAVGGSVLMGTNWSRSMFQVDGSGKLFYNPVDVRGGHAWLLYRGNKSRDEAGGQNTWGTGPASGMGPLGRFKLSMFGAFGLEALYKDDGDAYAVVELGTPAVEVAARAIEQGGLS